MTQKLNIDNAYSDSVDIRPAGNSGLAKVAVQCSADTFVVNQSLVLRINICGENRHLRQAAKRYPPLQRSPPHGQAHLVFSNTKATLKNQKSLPFPTTTRTQII